MAQCGGAEGGSGCASSGSGGPSSTSASGGEGRERGIRAAGLRHALSGGVAGAFSKTCTAPLARLVILYQVRLRSSCAGLRLCVRRRAVAQPPVCVDL